MIISNLTEVMKIKKISERVLAAKSGISKSAIHKLKEDRYMQVSKVITLQRLAEAMNIRITDLFTITIEPKTKFKI